MFYVYIGCDQIKTKQIHCGYVLNFCYFHLLVINLCPLELHIIFALNDLSEKWEGAFVLLL